MIILIRILDFSVHVVALVAVSAGHFEKAQESEMELLVVIHMPAGGTFYLQIIQREVPIPVMSGLRRGEDIPEYLESLITLQLMNQISQLRELMVGQSGHVYYRTACFNIGKPVFNDPLFKAMVVIRRTGIGC